jgi:hypothetical protein
MGKMIRGPRNESLMTAWRSYLAVFHLSLLPFSKRCFQGLLCDGRCDSFHSLLSSLLVMLGIVFPYYHSIPEDRDRLTPTTRTSDYESPFISRYPALSVLSLLDSILYDPRGISDTGKQNAGTHDGMQGMGIYRLDGIGWEFTRTCSAWLLDEEYIQWEALQ